MNGDAPKSGSGWPPHLRWKKAGNGSADAARAAHEVTCVEVGGLAAGVLVEWFAGFRYVEQIGHKAYSVTLLRNDSVRGGGLLFRFAADGRPDAAPQFFRVRVAVEDVTADQQQHL